MMLDTKPAEDLEARTRANLAEIEASMAFQNSRTIQETTLPALAALHAIACECRGKGSPLEREVTALRARAYRQREKLKEYDGMVIASRELLSAETLTPEQVERELDKAAGELPVAIFGKEEAEAKPIELSKDTRTRFMAPEAGYIIDAAYSFMNDMVPKKRGDVYVITTTLEEVYRRAGAEGEMRAKIKDALYPRGLYLGKPIAPLLSYIDIIRGKLGSRVYLRLPFLTTGKVVAEDTARLRALRQGCPTLDSPAAHEEVLAIELRIHQAAYSCIPSIHEALDRARGIGVGSGYIMLPRALSLKVGIIIDGLCAEAARVPGTYPGLWALRNHAPELRQATLKAIEKYEAGKAAREGPMVLTGEELRELGILPKLAKNKPRRPECMAGLGAILGNLLRDGEAFQGCGRITRDGEALTFWPKA